MAKNYGLPPQKEHDYYIDKIYGGNAPSMGKYRGMGESLRRKEEAEKRRRQAAARAKQREQQSSLDQLIASLTAQAEQKQSVPTPDKVTDELTARANATRGRAAERDKSSNTQQDSGGGFFGNVKGLANDLLDNITHVGSTAAKGVGELGKVAFTDYTMEDMRKSAQEQAEINKRDFRPYSGEFSSNLSREVDRGFKRAANTGTLGGMKHSIEQNDFDTSAFDSSGRSGGGKAADFGYDILGSLVPGAKIASSIRGTKLGANTIGKGLGGRIASTAKEGAVAGGAYAGLEGLMAEGNDPNERDFIDHTKNILMEMGFGAVLDPAISELGGAILKRFRRGEIDINTAKQEMETQIRSLGPSDGYSNGGMYDQNTAMQRANAALDEVLSGRPGSTNYTPDVDLKVDGIDELRRRQPGMDVGESNTTDWTIPQNKRDVVGSQRNPDEPFNLNEPNIRGLLDDQGGVDPRVTQAMEQLDEVNNMVRTRENDVVEETMLGYNDQMQRTAEAETQWTQAKEAKSELKRINDTLGRNQVRVPDEVAEEWGNRLPKNLKAARGKNAAYDVYTAADELGYSSDPTGVEQMLDEMDRLRELSSVRKKDVLPDDAISAKDVAGLEEQIRQTFRQSDEARSTQEIADALQAEIDNIMNPRTTTKQTKVTGTQGPGNELDTRGASLATRNNAEPSQGQALPNDDVIRQGRVNVSSQQGMSPIDDLINQLEQMSYQSPTQTVQTPKSKGNNTPSSTSSKGNNDGPIARTGKLPLSERLRNIPENIKDSKNRLKYEGVSEFQPAKDVEKLIAKWDTDKILKRTPDGSVSVTDSLFKGLRNANRSSRIAAESIEKSYAPIVSDLKKAGIKVEDFEEYALARHIDDILQNNKDKANRAKEIAEELKKTKINSKESLALEKELEGLEDYIIPEKATPEWIRDTIDNYKDNPDMNKAQKKFIKEQREDIVRLQKAGRYSEKEAVRMLNEHPNYVSMRRDIEELSDVYGKGTGSTSSRVGEPFKRRKKGSTSSVLPPLESAMQNRIRAIDTSMKNQALSKIKSLVKVDGADKIFKQIKNSDPFFANVDKVTFYENGKEVHYEVPTSLARMFNNLGGNSTDNPALKALENVTVFSKKGMTHFNPDFLVKSPIRDIGNAMFTSRSGVTPFNAVAGFMDSIAGNSLNKLTGGRFKTYKDVFKETGGDFSSYISMDIKDIDQVQKAMKSGSLGKGKEVINPFKSIEKLGATLERGPRLAEYRSSKKKGYSDEDSIFEATDVMDYADLGNTIKKLNKVAPYLGATMRGNLRTMQAMKENPAKALTRGFTYITVPTLAAYSMRYAEGVTDDQRTKMNNMPNWQKNLFWSIPNPSEDSDSIYMIPKPFLVGQAFANPVERGLDKMLNDVDNKDAGTLASETMEDFKTALMPPTAIAGISTLIEISNNRDSFMDMPIEDAEMQRKEPEDRYNSFTSELAKGMGKMMNLSPAKIDHFIKGTTGGLGSDVLDLTDNLAASSGVDRPSKTKTNSEIINPFNQFKFNEQGASKYANELYEAQNKEANEKSLERAAYKERTGEDMPNDMSGSSRVKMYHNKFQEVNKEIKKIRESTSMNPSAKKREISKLRDRQRKLGDEVAASGVLSEDGMSKPNFDKGFEDELVKSMYEPQQIMQRSEKLKTENSNTYGILNKANANDVDVSAFNDLVRDRGPEAVEKEVTDLLMNTEEMFNSNSEVAKTYRELYKGNEIIKNAKDHYIANGKPFPYKRVQTYFNSAYKNVSDLESQINSVKDDSNLSSYQRQNILRDLNEQRDTAEDNANKVVEDALRVGLPQMQQQLEGQVREQPADTDRLAVAAFTEAGVPEYAVNQIMDSDLTDNEKAYALQKILESYQSSR